MSVLKVETPGDRGWGRKLGSEAPREPRQELMVAQNRPGAIEVERALRTLSLTHQLFVPSSLKPHGYFSVSLFG